MTRNNWGTALAVCLAIDLIGSLGANAWRQRPSYHELGRAWEPGSGSKRGEPAEQPQAIRGLGFLLLALFGAARLSRRPMEA